VNIVCHPLDLGDSRSIDKLRESCSDIDILVNNAGAIPAGTLGSIDEAAWREAWDLKVFGYINLCRSLYPAMAQRQRGVILNIVGVAGGVSHRGPLHCRHHRQCRPGRLYQGIGGYQPGRQLSAYWGINPGLTATDRSSD